MTHGMWRLMRRIRAAFAYSGGRQRRSFADICGVVCFTPISRALLSQVSLHQFGKPQQIRDPQQCAPAADHNLRIRCDDVGPVLRHRADMVSVEAQQEPRAVPVVPLADADELSSAERMEGVRHAHKTRHRVRRPCILG